MEQWLSEVRAQELVAELEVVSGGRIKLSTEARAYLLEEFAGRLAHSPQPEALYSRWMKNAPKYIVDVIKRRGLHDVTLEPEDLRTQFLSCSELCPGPEKPLKRSQSGSGSAMSG